MKDVAKEDVHTALLGNILREIVFKVNSEYDNLIDKVNLVLTKEANKIIYAIDKQKYKKEINISKGKIILSSSSES